MTAVIQLRTNRWGDVLELQLDGSHPSKVDMPIRYTQNLRNVGHAELLTALRINDVFDRSDPDTFPETV